jgi:hypothetical protein
LDPSLFVTTDGDGVGITLAAGVQRVADVTRMRIDPPKEPLSGVP